MTRAELLEFAGYSFQESFDSVKNGLSTERLVIAISLGRWFLLTLAALLLFRQSMKRYKVRTGHVIRVWVYSVSPVIVIAPALVVLYEWAEILSVGRFVGLRLPNNRHVGFVAVFILAYSVWCTRQGYRHYLGMRHCLPLAVAAQVVAFLAFSLTELTLGSSIRLPNLAFEVWRILGLW